MASARKRIIACEGVKPELTRIIEETSADADCVFIGQELHRHPERIKEAVEAVLDAAPSALEEVVLGYGLCSNGVVGIEARERRLIIPKVHDCIGMYLGSLDRYKAMFEQRPGTYYLTTGWIEKGKDPLTTMREEYAARVGMADAEEAMREELQHYSTIAFIDLGLRPDMERFKKVARENAEYFGLEYVEIVGDWSLLRKMVEGPYNPSEFVIVEPGGRVEQKRFL
ncbi:MAG: DUF1638 domain-containing protein [Candidatus Hydrogenedentota bacterium]